MKMYIRWMGAFKKGGTNLKQSIAFELNRKDEAVCEMLHSSWGSIHAKVGLLIKEEAIFRSFKHDCWSRYDNEGRLYATDLRGNADHSEHWFHCDGAVYGIVIKGSINMLSKEIKAQVLCHNMPVYAINESGRLRKEWTP